MVVVIKKRILIIFSISLVFVSCSKSIYLDTPRKGTYKKIEYISGVVSIDPNDTITIKERSKTENFTIKNIEKRGGFYDIIVESDSIRDRIDAKGRRFGSGHYGYRIISLKTKNIKISKKIKTGKRYTMTLIPCFIYPPNTFLSSEGLYVYTKGMYILVFQEDLCIYTTPNLDGLHYIKPSRKEKRTR